MINTAPLLALLTEFEHLVALCAGVILGYAAGRPVKRRIIRKWAMR